MQVGILAVPTTHRQQGRSTEADQSQGGGFRHHGNLKVVNGDDFISYGATICQFLPVHLELELIGLACGIEAAACRPSAEVHRNGLETGTDYH